MVEFWRFGGTPVPTAEIGRLAQRFESLGWHGLVVGEDVGVLSESYICLAVAAASTKRLKVGTGVSVPLRHPMQAANAVVTLDAVSGGRSLVSFGRGDGGLAQVGLPPISVADFGAYVDKVQAYLRRDHVELDGFDSTMAGVYRSDASLVGPKPAVDISATGPKMIALGARIGESLSFAVGANVERLADCIRMAKEARTHAGGVGAELKFGAYVAVAVTSDRERSQARDVIRGAVLRHARFSAFHGQTLAGVADADQETVLRAFEATRDHSRNAPKRAEFALKGVIDDEFVDRFGIVGTPAECADRLLAMIETGIHRLVIMTRVPGTDPAEENSARIAQEVFPLLA
jgi:5,10-methylenetetrahydromethanopterin reductase